VLGVVAGARPTPLLHIPRRGNIQPQKAVSRNDATTQRKITRFANLRPLEVIDTRIHKVNGTPRFTYEGIEIKELR
jgi:hypothetical protein